MPLVDIARKICDDVISTDDAILATSVMDMKGNILASQSKQTFRDNFEVTIDDRKNSGTWAIVILGMCERFKHVFGSSEAIINIHKSCKTMLIPIRSRQILIGLVVQRSANAEDFIANKVRILLEGLEEIRDNIAVRNGTAAVFLISLFMSNILYILGGWIL
jgi:hypothetical protein